MQNDFRRPWVTAALLLTLFAAMSCGTSTRRTSTNSLTPGAAPPRLAYITTEAPSGDLSSVISHLYLATLGRAPTKIRDYPGQQYYEILGSPDGKIIAVTGGQMVLLSAEGDELMRAGTPAVSFSGAGPFASWSPDSAVFAYTRVDYATTDPSHAGWIETIDVASRKITTPDKLKASVLTMPSFSPDGKSFAAVAATSAGADARAIVIANVNGDQRVLTDKPTATIATPLWSPDGKWIAYWVPNGVVGDDGRRIADQAIYLIPAQGGTPTLLTEAGYPSPQAWSPDGSSLALSCVERRDANGETAAKSNVCTVSPDGSELTVLTTDGTSFGGAFSPDGTSIAYLTDRDKNTGTFTLKVLRLDSHEVTTVAPSVPFGGFSWLASP